MKVKNKQNQREISDFRLREILSGVLRDAYLKTIQNWEAKIYSGNWCMWIEEEFLKRIRKYKQ